MFFLGGFCLLGTDHPRGAFQAGEKTLGAERGRAGHVQKDAGEPHQQQRQPETQGQNVMGESVSLSVPCLCWSLMTWHLRTFCWMHVIEQERVLSIVTCLALVFNCFMIFLKKKKEKKTQLKTCSALVYPCLSAGSQLEVAVRCHSSGHWQRGIICGHSCPKLNWARNDSQPEPLKQRGTCGGASQRLSKEGANAVQSVASSLSLHCHSHCVATLFENLAWRVINHQCLRWERYLWADECAGCCMSVTLPEAISFFCHLFFRLSIQMFGNLLLEN